MKYATTTRFTRWRARLLDSGHDGSRRGPRSATCLLLVLGGTAGCACSGVEPEPAAAEATAVSNDANPAAPEASSAMSPSSVPQSILDAALDDAATRTSIDRANISVISAAAVTWSDGSAGCPEPGMMYTQALVPGYRIVLQAGEQVLNYHAGRAGAPKFCPAERVLPPASAGAQPT